MSGNFPPDFFAPDYFPPDYFGGEANANAISASIAGVASVSGTLTAASQPQEQASARGGDDAPRSHVGIRPRLIKDRKRRIGVEIEEIAALYDRILGLVPEEPTKAQQRVVAKVAKAIGKPAVKELPPAVEVDFAAIEAKAARALQEAYERLLDDDDEAIIALLAA